MLSFIVRFFFYQADYFLVKFSSCSVTIVVPKPNKNAIFATPRGPVAAGRLFPL